MKNLFVGNISFQTSESELQALFEPFGEVTRVQIMTDRDTGRSRGFGFVEMANDEDAAKAMLARSVPLELMPTSGMFNPAGPSGIIQAGGQSMNGCANSVAASDARSTTTR